MRLWIPSRGFWRPGMLLFTDTAGPLPGKWADRGGCVCVFLSLLSMKYVSFPLPLALLATVSVCKMTIFPVEWRGCLNPKFEGMGCCITFIFVLLCVLIRFGFSVPVSVLNTSFVPVMAVSEMFPTNFQLHTAREYFWFPSFGSLWKHLTCTQALKAFQKCYVILQIAHNNGSDYLKRNSLHYI